MNALIRYLSLLLLGFVMVPNHSDAQILNRIIKRTKDKAIDKAEDMIVEKVSEEIARRIYLSMSDAFDKMLSDARSRDSIYYARNADSLGIDMQNFANVWLERMNSSVDLPESYELDIKLNVETTYNKDSRDQILRLSSTAPLFAMTEEEKQGTRTILIDAEKDVTVLYFTNSKGEKSAQAIPKMFGLTASMAGNMEDKQEDFTFKKTGKTKKVAGYSSEEYVGEDSDYKYTFYFSNDVGVDWKAAYGPIIEKFGNYKRNQEFDQVKGMFLESISENKKGKDKTTWVTKSVDKESYKIVNADYEFGNLNSME